MNGDSRPIDLDRLLAHGGFVRAVARSLVLDENRADDLVQETFLRALRRGPDEPSRLKGWLAAVTRNLARSLRRAEDQRRLRESAWREPSVPWPEEILAREELRRRVVEAVFSLAEPYRSAVLLRHYEERTPEQIAARLGVPVRTVWTRLHRARALLRDKLEADCGGDRSWRQGLFLLAGVEPKAAAAAATFLASGPVLVAALLLLGTAATLLVLTVGGRPPGGDAPAVTVAEPATADPATHRGDSAGDDLTTEAERAAVSVAAEPVPPGAIRCRVLDPSGAPIDDAGVRARVFGSNDAFAPARVLRVADEFILETGGAAPLDLEFAADGFVAARRGPAWPGESFDLYLQPGTTVRGHVVDADSGAPLSDAHVTLRVERNGGSAITPEVAEDGTFTLVVPEVSWSLWVGSSGHVPWERHAFRPDQDGGVLEVRLPRSSAPGGFTFVRVVDPATRRPIAGATFEPGPAEDLGGGLFRVFCSSDWDFAPSGFEVQAPGYLLVLVSVEGEIGRDPMNAIEVLLPAPIAVTGRVVGENGEPVSGATVELQRSLFRDNRITPRVAQSWREATDATGGFRIDGLAPPDLVLHRLLVTHPDFAPLVQHCREIPDSAPFTLPAIVLERGRTLKGRVLAGEDRAPIAGARVVLEPSFPSERRSLLSGETGAFAFEHVAGKALLTVRAAGLLPWSLTVGATTGDIEVLLDAGQSISGIVVDAAGQPVPGATVRAEFESWLEDPAHETALGILRGGVTAQADAHGRFRVEGLLPGPYILSAARTGPPGRPWQAFMTRAAAGDTDVAVTVETGSGIALCLMGDGRPVLRYSYKVARAAGSDWTFGGLYGSEPNADGTCFVELPPGTVADVMVEAEGFAPFVLSEVSVAPGEIREVLCVLQVAASLEGTVTSASGAPVPDVALEIARTDLERPAPGLNVSTRVATTDAAGRYRFPILGPGEWRIVQATEGRYGETLRRPVEVTPALFQLGAAERRTENLRLFAPQGATLKGRVTLPEEDGNQKVRVLVIAEPSPSAGDNRGFVAPVDGDGCFAIDDLPAGEYGVSLEIRVDRGDGRTFTRITPSTAS